MNEIETKILNKLFDLEKDLGNLTNRITEIEKKEETWIQITKNYEQIADSHQKTSVNTLINLEAAVSSLQRKANIIRELRKKVLSEF